MFPNYSSLEFGDWETVYDTIIAQQLNEFASFPFEDVCIEWLRLQNKKRSLPFVFTQIGRWWDKNVEVDIIAANEDRSKIISAECKFHNSPVNDFDLSKHLKKDLSNLRKKDDAQISFWYFSWSGYTKEARQFAEENGICIVTAEEMF